MIDKRRHLGPRGYLALASERKAGRLIRIF